MKPNVNKYATCAPLGATLRETRNSIGRSIERLRPFKKNKEKQLDNKTCHEHSTLTRELFCLDHGVHFT